MLYLPLPAPEVADLSVRRGRNVPDDERVARFGTDRRAHRRTDVLVDPVEHGAVVDVGALVGELLTRELGLGPEVRVLDGRALN